MWRVVLVYHIKSRWNTLHLWLQCAKMCKSSRGVNIYENRCIWWPYGYQPIPRMLSAYENMCSMRKYVRPQWTSVLINVCSLWAPVWNTTAVRKQRELLCRYSLSVGHVEQFSVWKTNSMSQDKNPPRNVYACIHEDYHKCYLMSLYIHILVQLHPNWNMQNFRKICRAEKCSCTIPSHPTVAHSGCSFTLPQPWIIWSACVISFIADKQLVCVLQHSPSSLGVERSAAFFISLSCTCDQCKNF